MSGRRNANNRIRGPQSALTDFLASNNISAAQIRADYERRRQNAPGSDRANDGPGTDPVNLEIDDDDGGAETEKQEDEDGNRVLETPAQQRRRKRKEKVTLEKIKQSKAFKKRKAALAGEPGEGDDDEIAFDVYERSRPPPGQFANCDHCDKRFTVTVYSKEGPNGGLLCPKCSKEKDDNDKRTKKPKKTAIKRTNRRQNASDFLDGKAHPGARALLETCLVKVADVSNDIDDFGLLPEDLLDRLAMIFSKRRIMNSRTVHLFVRPDRRKITIFDAGDLETSDYANIFAIAPKLKHFKATMAGQMKDASIDYIISKGLQLESLQLEATNLVNDEKWRELFMHLGHGLQQLKIDSMDASFNDDTVRVLVEHCPNLVRLKLRDCWKLSEESIRMIQSLKQLKHLSLKYKSDVSGECITNLISVVGAGLQTLSLDDFPNAGDDFLTAVHDTCTQIGKLRFSHNDYATDSAFAHLFDNWMNPPLKFVDMNSCRDIDNNNPDGPEVPTGLASDGFAALMRHSGQQLRYLNVESCRHIGHEALLEVFDGKRIYPELRELNVSFITVVDDVSVMGIFRSCPKLKRLIVFGCFRVGDAKIPPGVALIGSPRAQDSIILGDASHT